MTPRIWAASSRSLLLLLGLAIPAVAQGPATVVGRVVRVQGADTLALPGVEVVLHRIGQDTQGPLDSLAAAADGRFRFRFVTDSGSLYLLSARHHGITYFTSPVAREPATRVDDILLIVADTSSDAPVRLAARSLIIGAPESSGHRPVVEVLEFANRGTRTRVSPEGMPTFVVPLARGGDGFVIEDTDLSPESVLLRGDSLLVMAPLSPGGRMAILQYRIPAGTRRVTLPPGTATDSLQLLLEAVGTSPAPELPGADDEIIEGRRYRRWIGPWSAEQPLVVALPGVTLDQRLVLGGLVAASLLALLVGWRRLQRRPVTARIATPGTGPEGLLDAIARLDARYAETRATTPDAEWRRYEAERARLKRELERRLAGRGGSA